MNQNEIRKELRAKAMEASKHAYSPYSQAKVGSAILTDSGKIYFGCNIENGSYGATVCAERVAILTAVANGEKRVKVVYVYTEEGWPPCGMCRQVIREFADDDATIIIGDAKGAETVMTLEELYPLSFRPDHLGV
ncbi:MAG: cytidine deaminase [Oligoflexia bacterium]|nr:cytidine deaminase [Oligoflexia bacterium]MBF0367686.1 cytidine deaminase [Oligoflexia bacterium]